MNEETEDKTILLIFIFIIGLAIGYLTAYKLNLRVTDDQVEYVENFMRYYQDGHFIPDSITEKATVGYVIDLYFRYTFVSRSLLKWEIEKLCGIRPIKRTELNTTIDRNFCEELCPK